MKHFSRILRFLSIVLADVGVFLPSEVFVQSRRFALRAVVPIAVFIFPTLQGAFVPMIVLIPLAFEFDAIISAA